MRQWNILRDILLFVGGMAGVAYETTQVKTDRVDLLLLYAAMIGLPTFLPNGVVEKLQSRAQQYAEPEKPEPKPRARKPPAKKTPAKKAPAKRPPARRKPPTSRGGG